MASTFYWNNKQISLPGAYSTIVSGETGPARQLDYGKVLVIDTGTYSAGFGGGAGINGEIRAVRMLSIHSIQFPIFVVL